jgi:hypothetical protein
MLQAHQGACEDRAHRRLDGAKRPIVGKMNKIICLRYGRQRTGPGIEDRYSCRIVSNGSDGACEVRCAVCAVFYLPTPLRRRTAGQAQGRVIILRLMQALPNQVSFSCQTFYLKSSVCMRLFAALTNTAAAEQPSLLKRQRLGAC